MKFSNLYVVSYFVSVSQARPRVAITQIVPRTIGHRDTMSEYTTNIGWCLQCLVWTGDGLGTPPATIQGQTVLSKPFLLFGYNHSPCKFVFLTHFGRGVGICTILLQEPTSKVVICPRLFRLIKDVVQLSSDHLGWNYISYHHELNKLYFWQKCCQIVFDQL